MPPQSKKLDLSGYTPEQQQAIRQQLETSLKMGALNPAQRASIESTLKTFPTIQGEPVSMPTSESRVEEPSVANTAQREVMSFLKSFPQMVTGTYEAATQPKSAQEAKQFPSALDYPAMLYERMLHAPVTAAGDWYSKVARGQVPNAYEQALTAAPEAIGQATAAPVASKLLSPKTGAAGVRGAARGVEAVANQRLLPLRELLNLNAPADEAAALRVKIPGRNLGLEPTPPSIEELTKQAIEERRALPTKLRVAEPPAPAAPRRVAPPPVSGFKRLPTAAETAAASAGSEGIHGSLPKGTGRMVVTPEEAQRLQQLHEVAKRAAHERGMAFAGGQVPAGGRKVPYIPQPSVTEEYGGPRMSEQELESRAARQPATPDIKQQIVDQASKVRNLRMRVERLRAAHDPEASVVYQEWRAAEDQLHDLHQTATQASTTPRTLSSQGGGGANYTAEDLAKLKERMGLK